MYTSTVLQAGQSSSQILNVFLYNSGNRHHIIMKVVTIVVSSLMLMSTLFKITNVCHKAVILEKNIA